MPKKSLKEPDYLIVGLQKSGTYWLASILDAHPEVSCFPNTAGQKNGVGEGHVFDILASIDEDEGKRFTRAFTGKHHGYFADLVPYLNKVSREKLYDMFRERYTKWCDSYRGKKRLVGDKTAEYVFHLDLIDYFYPNIKKICVVRDPKDRVVSYHFHRLRKGGKTEKNIIDEFVKEYIERVKKDYNSILDYKGHIHCLAYESLSNNPKEAIKGILAYLGLEISDEIIYHMIESGSFKRVSARDSYFNKKMQNIEMVSRALFGFLGSRVTDKIIFELKKLLQRRVRLMSINKIDDNIGREKGEEQLSSHYRKGIVGDWKNHLTNKQAAMIDAELKDLQNKVFEKYNVKRATHNV